MWQWWWKVSFIGLWLYFHLLKIYHYWQFLLSTQCKWQMENKTTHQMYLCSRKEQILGISTLWVSLNYELLILLPCTCHQKSSMNSFTVIRFRSHLRTHGLRHVATEGMTLKPLGSADYLRNFRNFCVAVKLMLISNILHHWPCVNILILNLNVNFCGKSYCWAFCPTCNS